MASDRRVVVFGPAYLDRVIRVDRPLVDPGAGPPLDQSVDGTLSTASLIDDNNLLTLLDPGGNSIRIELPTDWPGPAGEIRLSRSLLSGQSAGCRTVNGIAWKDDLGGMGAGYAAALGGVLVSALGSPSDPASCAITDLLAEAGIATRPFRIPGHSADWTLLVSSGAHGDKLPIGFRGCHAALDDEPLGNWSDEPVDLKVVASLPNRLAARALRGKQADVRFFAPAMRNMLDRDPPLATFAGSIDVLCCNRREWESLEDREQVAWAVSILAVTDGPEGCAIRYTRPDGDPGRLRLPAFPRSRPPRDTNRAGEAFASTLVSSLLDGGWEPASGVVDEALIEQASRRASAAASLVLDRLDFGFPTASEIDTALAAGVVV
jgi:ribokinase